MAAAVPREGWGCRGRGLAAGAPAFLPPGVLLACSISPPPASDCLSISSQSVYNFVCERLIRSPLPPPSSSPLGSSRSDSSRLLCWEGTGEDNLPSTRSAQPLPGLRDTEPSRWAGGRGEAPGMESHRAGRAASLRPVPPRRAGYRCAGGMERWVLRDGAADVPSAARAEVVINPPQRRAARCPSRGRRATSRGGGEQQRSIAASSPPAYPTAFLLYGKSHYCRIRLPSDSHQRLWSPRICLTLDLSGAINFNTV